MELRYVTCTIVFGNDPASLGILSITLCYRSCFSPLSRLQRAGHYSDTQGGRPRNIQSVSIGVCHVTWTFPANTITCNTDTEMLCLPILWAAKNSRWMRHYAESISCILNILMNAIWRKHSRESLACMEIFVIIRERERVLDFNPSLSWRLEVG